MLIEAILFLNENRDMQSIKDVSECLCRVRENEKKKRTKKRMQTYAEEEDQVAGDTASAEIQQIIDPFLYNEDNSD